MTLDPECLLFISKMQAFQPRNASIPAVKSKRFRLDYAVLSADVVGYVGGQEAHGAFVAHGDEGGLFGEEPTGEGAQTDAGFSG